tara:strand:- start:2321 stop:4381 length:2061 start_codon:yes stop_codon:yes gene_type:complete
MVIKGSIDIDDMDEDYMDGDEEEGIFFDDDDLKEEFMAPVLTNAPSKPSKFTIPWKALRLPAAAGDGRIATLKGLFAGTRDIRSSPYAYVIPVSSWNQYINNMDARDVAAEMNAPVSDFEKASLYLFAEEWRNEVTHDSFKRRLIDHPLVNVAQETAKGQLVFDIVTGKVTAKGGRPDTKHEEMLRLAMDILQSIRLQYYTFYSVNLLHGHEGPALYAEFLSRYVPLEAQEVAIVKEIEMGVRAKGRSYAVNTSNPMADAITTFNLMLRIVESYNLGDTMTVRAGISALLSAPINYKSSARHTINTDTLGRTNVVRSGDVVGIAFKAGKMKDAKKGNEVHYMLKNALKSDGELTGKRDAMFNQLFDKKHHWVEVEGINDSTPKNVWHAPNGDNLKKQTFQSYLELGVAAADVNNTVAPQQQGNRARRGSVRNNPSDRGFKNTQEALEEAVAAAQLENTAYVVAFIPNKPYGRLGTFAISPVDQHEVYFRHLYPQYTAGMNDIYTISPSGQVYDERKILSHPKPAKNPVTVGQGQHFFIQLRNPRDFTFTAKEKKNAKRSKGTMSIAGTPGKDRTGLNDILGGFEKAGYVAWSGTHKKTGKRMPWIIQLPRKKGKTGSVKFKKARVTDKDTGQSYSTIRPFTADKKIKAAWEKFVATYGEPIYDNNPKKRSLFKIRRKNRGSYYKRK